MNSTPAVVISQSALMHISLAHLSEELQVLDTIIESTAFSKKTSSPSLPTEILLIIRSYVLVNATNHLVSRSSSALKRYETSLRHLLCQECISYHEHVYGDDLWQWEQFSGACACSQSRHNAQRHFDWDYTIPRSLNPKKFINRAHWLEFYLSLKSLRLLHSGLANSTLTPNSSAVIWDLVSSVLQEFGCHTIRREDLSDVSSPSSLHEKCETDIVLVVPSRTSTCKDLFDQDWVPQVTLKRAERDLGLSDYRVDEDCFSASPNIPKHPSTVPLSRRSSSEGRRASPCFENHFVSIFPTNVARSLSTMILTALSLPVSILTLALTIACYYSRPGAFRLLR